jgi:hypothetical protein
MTPSEDDTLVIDVDGAVAQSSSRQACSEKNRDDAANPSPIRDLQ